MLKLIKLEMIIDTLDEMLSQKSIALQDLDADIQSCNSDKFINVLNPDQALH